MRPSSAGDYLRQRLGRPLAVLIIDVQRAFFAEDGSTAAVGHDTAPMRAALPTIARLLAFARGAGIPLVHVRTEGLPWLNWPAHVAPPAMLERARLVPAGTSFLVPGTPDVELAPEARPLAGEPVLTKHAYDAFLDTPLELVLRRLGASTPLLAGLTTECCVETTARSALGHGFAVVVVEDAVAAADRSRHEARLTWIAPEAAPQRDAPGIGSVPRAARR